MCVHFLCVFSLLGVMSVYSCGPVNFRCLFLLIGLPSLSLSLLPALSLVRRVSVCVGICHCKC